MALEHYEIHAIDQELLMMRDIRGSIPHSEDLQRVCDEKMDWLLDRRNEVVTRLFEQATSIIPVVETA